MKQIVLLGLLAIVALVGVMGYRTATYQPPFIEKAQINAPAYDADRLASEHVCNDYIALTQMPGYAQEAAWRVEAERSSFIEKNKLRFLIRKILFNSTILSFTHIDVFSKIIISKFVLEFNAFMNSLYV